MLIAVHQDGGSRGKPRPSPAARTPRTIVSTTTTADDQTILAARREMQQWRMLALEPSAMRNPDSSGVDPHPTASGAHLAATLYRMARDHGPDIYSEVAAEASALIDIRELVVDYDQRRDSLTLLARIGTGPLLPASSLSDGTLRFLALCIMRADDSIGGLLCMEEPENGIHPGRIETMVDLVQSLGVDPPPLPARGTLCDRSWSTLIPHCLSNIRTSRICWPPSRQRSVEARASQPPCACCPFPEPGEPHGRTPRRWPGPPCLTT